MNLTNTKGDTLLMLATYHGHEPAVDELLKRGADPDRSNDRGQTPLAAAVFKNAPGIVELLSEANADPQAGHPSALETARFFQRVELAERLERRLTR
jgi:ankyrin repeat protein